MSMQPQKSDSPGPSTGQNAKSSSDWKEMPLVEKTTDTGDATSQVSYLDKAKRVYGPLQAPENFIVGMGAVFGWIEARKSKRCDSPEKEAQAMAILTEALDYALHALVAAPLMKINQVTAIAMDVRALVPDQFDAWVDMQFSTGSFLGVLSAKRSLMDVARESYAEVKPASRRASAAMVMGAQQQFENFVGIFRVKLEAELEIDTTHEQTELDLALNDLLIAGRASFAAQSFMGPLPDAEHYPTGVAMLKKAKTFLRGYQVTIDRMRARARRKSKKVRVVGEPSVAARAKRKTSGKTSKTMAVSA